ncbi:MAG: hypothetical protein SGPRY_003576 [Prymnesium sp.]
MSAWNSTKHRPCRSWGVIPGCDGCHLDRDYPVRGGKPFTPRAAGRGGRGRSSPAGRSTARTSSSPRSVQVVTPAPTRPPQLADALPAAQDFAALFDAPADVSLVVPTPSPGSVCMVKRVDSPAAGLYEPYVPPSRSPSSLPSPAAEMRVDRSRLLACRRRAALLLTRAARA